ncbi:MAG TPA: cobalt ECF transporter T component CbiQ [Acidimicrobiales bacterium]|jgi:cobalt/nickel transport system permease protein|nr:cobalt ECF transporter T component CbiQ [Acidimicrobiales bacterium]
MGGSHAHGSSWPHASVTRVHRLPPECKVLATVLFILAVVATPREQIWALAAQAGVVLVVVGIARLPLRNFVRRLTIELPFVAFALFLPLLARGDRVDVGPIALSSDGLWAAWNIVAKATIGVGMTLVLAATTTTTDLVRGLERLRVPRVFTAIAGFMVRYLDIVRDEMRRMRIARESRGHDPRWFWHARAVAHGAGALFVRSYERGERVHLAMVSRGFDGRLPVAHVGTAERRQWLDALALPAVAAVLASTAWVVAR